MTKNRLTLLATTVLSAAMPCSLVVPQGTAAETRQVADAQDAEAVHLEAVHLEAVNLAAVNAEAIVQAERSPLRRN